MDDSFSPEPKLRLELLEDRLTPAGYTVPAGESNWLQFSPTGQLAELVWQGQTLVYRARVGTGWQDEAVVANGSFSSTSYDTRDAVQKASQSAQLVFTTDGTPHVLFLDPSWVWQSNGYQTVIRDYAKIGGRWSLVNTITTPWLSNWGPTNLIAEAGSNNSIHLMFTETYNYATSVSNQGSGILWYGSNRSGSWKFDKIADTADLRQDVWFTGGRWAPRFLSMAIDTANNAHVTYAPKFYIAGAFSTVQSTLMYASNASGGWRSETIMSPQDGTADAGLGASIALSPTGVAGVASYYVDRFTTGSPQTSKLMYHTRDSSGNWAHQDAVTSPDNYAAGDGAKFTGFSPQLYFDAQGQPNIVFSDEAGEHLAVSYANQVSGQIRAAVLVNGQWQVQTVFRQSDPLVNQLFYPVVATNGSTTVYAGLQITQRLDGNKNPTGLDVSVIELGAPNTANSPPSVTPPVFTNPAPATTTVPANAPVPTVPNVPIAVTSPTTVTTPSSPAGLAVGTDAGVRTTVAVYRADGSLDFSITPFGDDYSGGARVARADVTGDGVPDVIVGSGGQMQTHVRIWNGATRQLIFDTVPFSDFSGGVVLAAGDINRDGFADIAIGPDLGGGPRLQLWSGKTLTKLMPDFFGLPYPDFRGGLRLAVGDITRDGFADLVVAPGEGGGPRITLYDGNTLGAGKNPRLIVNDFFIFDESLRSGLSLAAGDIDGDGYADVIAGAGYGGGPRVRVVSGYALAQARGVYSTADFLAGDENDRNGVRVAVRNFDGDGRSDLVVASGAGSEVRTFTGSGIMSSAVPNPVSLYDAFPGIIGGVFVG